MICAHINWQRRSVKNFDSLMSSSFAAEQPPPPPPPAQRPHPAPPMGAPRRFSCPLHQRVGGGFGRGSVVSNNARWWSHHGPSQQPQPPRSSNPPPPQQQSTIKRNPTMLTNFSGRGVSFRALRPPQRRHVTSKIVLKIKPTISSIQF